MKNKVLFTGILVLFSLVGSTVFSQNLYIKLGGGYGLSLASQFVYDNGVATTHDYQYGSFGEGVNFGLGFGVMVNKNLGFELAGSYILGKKFERTFGTTISTTAKDYANTIIIMPSVVLKTDLNNISPYTRFGMVLGIPSKFYEETQTGTGALAGTFKEKESGGLALGIQGAVGINIKAGKRIGIFGEIYGIGMNYAPGQIENTDAYTGGTIIPLKTYQENWTPAAGDNILGKPRYPFSSFGINVGLTINLGK